MSEARRTFDYALLFVAVGLALVGLPMIASATSGVLAREGLVWRQVVGLAVGTAIGAGLLWLPFDRLRRAVVPLYIGSLVLLFLVVTPLGHEVNGARRWLEVGGVQFQPSELARLAMVLMLADYLAKNRGRLRDFAGIVVPGIAIVLAPIFLLFPQRDLGSILILFGLALAMFYVAGLHLRHLGPSAAFAGLLGVVLVAREAYRLDRLQGFLSPFAARYEQGYQVVEGWIALASGGWIGVGYANGLAQHGKLPEPHTDFIAAVVAEEWGATGFLFIVLLQCMLVWRATHVAARSKDLFGMLAGAGIAATFGAQAIVNLSVVGGLLPPKGLVLPFVSYGASAAMIHAASIGLLLKIGMAAEPEAQPTDAQRARTWEVPRPVEVRRKA